MKQLIVSLLAMVTITSMAQFPGLPYNPDENGDGFIGVVDLQGLLANYGSEFSGAMVAEDGESAMLYMGNMAYPLCSQACKNLPGIWQLPRLEDLGLVWDEVNPANQVYNSSVYTWLQGSWNPYNYLPPYYRGVRNTSNVLTSSIDPGQPDDGHRCYCFANQLPKVEYSSCEGTNIQECCSLKVAEGWYPLGNPTSAPQGPSPYYRWNQGFWRWAE